MKKINAVFIPALAAVYSVMLVVFSDLVGEYVRNAVNTCLTVIIPSLFAFTALCDFFVTSNAYKLFARPFEAISRYLFRIPPELFPVFMLSSFAGYPIGARLIDKLYRQDKIDRRAASDMLCYCYSGGPSFICGAAGVTLFGSVAAGLVIFAGVLLSNIAVAILTGLRRTVPPKRERERIIVRASLSGLTASVLSGAKATLAICAMVVFFSSILAVLEGLGLFSLLNARTGAIVRALLEISNIAGLPKDWELLPAAAAILSTGGLCVILQIKSFLHKDISMKNFYFSRLLSIFFSYLCSKIVIEAFALQESVQTMKTAGGAIAEFSGVSPVPAVFLLIMTVMLLSMLRGGSAGSSKISRDVKG